MASWPAPWPATPRAVPASRTAPGGWQTGQPMVFAPTAGMVRQQATAMPMAETPVADAQHGTNVPMWTPSLAPPALPAIPGCPAGLEYLTKIDHLLVHQVLQSMELILGFNLPNKYIVKNAMGQFVFKAIEMREFRAHRFGSKRPFTMVLFDYRNDKVLLLDRPLRCDCRLCCCCLQEMDVKDASGAAIGSLQMQFTLAYPTFWVLDSQKNVVLLIEGPCCPMSTFGGDVKFDILTNDGVTEIGAITKVSNGLFREACTEADNFTVTFPLDLDAKIKAVLIGAVFLLDYIFFDSWAGASCCD
ncbi:phospholipid scramblase 1-like isoform X2 [Dermacentor albipictus]